MNVTTSANDKNTMTGEDVKNTTGGGGSSIVDGRTTNNANTNTTTTTINKNEEDIISNNKKRKLLESRMGGSMPMMPAIAMPSSSLKPREEPAASVVARATAAPTPVFIGTGENNFTREANDCVHFHVVEGEEEEQEAALFSRKSEQTFEPEFAHQVFREDETIYGYSEDLSVDVMCAANTFERYVEVSYSEKVRSSLNPADDVRGDLHKWFPEASTATTKEAFAKRVEETKEMEIPGGGGRVIAEWDGEGEGVESGLRYSVRQFEFKESESDAVGRWHDNVEPFVAFYIDAASKIDKSDGRWLWFVLIAQKKDNLKRWATCGFSTVYQFYAHPFQRRLRISQVLVLPPYQRKGFGAKLLDAVRAYAQMQDKEGKDVADITVEDPTDQLQRLRDVRDCVAATENEGIVQAVKAAARLAFAAATASSSTANTNTNGDDDRKQKIKRAQSALRLPKLCYETNFKKDLKICEPQAKRVWEALLFIWAKQCQAPNEGIVADAFRTNVLNRLKKKHMASLGKGEDDVGSKRIRDTEDGFVMCKGGGEGERVEIEDQTQQQQQQMQHTKNQADDDENNPPPKDPAEALADLFHECMQNLSYLSSVVKI
jgi:histone acetyltransferase 1